MEPKIQQARRLRTNQTSAEKLIWYNLRDRRLNGLKFKRQQCLENYIVDFYCDELKLIIELDGNVHGYRSNSEKDAIKTSLPRKQGIRHDQIHESRNLPSAFRRYYHQMQ